jgi:hypothetical protein
MRLVIYASRKDAKSAAHNTNLRFVTLLDCQPILSPEKQMRFARNETPFGCNHRPIRNTINFSKYP